MSIHSGRLVLVALALTIGACSKGEGDGSVSATVSADLDEIIERARKVRGPAIPASAWKALPEDSVATTLPGSDIVARCWKREGRYDCVTASKDFTVEVARRIMPALPVNVEDLKPSVLGGYSCEMGRSAGEPWYLEKIRTPAGVIKSNSWRSTGGTPLQDAEIARVIKANGIETGFQPLWCSGLTNKLDNTSPAALASTEIGYADVVNRVVPVTPIASAKPAALFSAAEQRVIDRYDDLNSHCRGGPRGDGEAAAAAAEESCGVRDTLGERMTGMGLCSGTIDDDAGYQHKWHRCTSRSLARQPS